MARMGGDYKMVESDTTLIVCPDCGRELRPVNNTVGVWCPCGKIIDLKEVSK